MLINIDYEENKVVIKEEKIVNISVVKNIFS